MAKEHQKETTEIPSPIKIPDISKPIEPEEIPVPVDDPDTIPDEDPFETPPIELPAPGEGP